MLLETENKKRPVIRSVFHLFKSLIADDLRTTTEHKIVN